MSIAPTEKDYRFAMAIGLFLLMAFFFGLVLWRGGTVQDAIAAGIAPFVGLVSIIINRYFESKEG